jgi:hypothetical protein
MQGHWKIKENDFAFTKASQTFQFTEEKSVEYWLLLGMVLLV